MKKIFESEPKKLTSKEMISLPLPIPMVKSDGQMIWPFEANVWVNFIANVNVKSMSVVIEDEASNKALYLMGYFGNYGFIKRHENTDIKMNRNSDFKRKRLVNESECVKLNVINELPSESKYVLRHFSFDDPTNDSPENTNKSTLKDEQLIEPNECDMSIDSVGSEQRNDIFSLSYDEAFFLSYALGCLNVKNAESGTLMTIEQMWDLYCNTYSNDRLCFPVRYAAYHYFRSKGWIVKNGFIFGCDFILYKEGPPFYHALYSVTLIKQLNECECAPQLNWHYISGLTRVSKNVRKEVLLCFINVPDSLQSDAFKYPNCIEQFTIELFHLKRCVPSKRTDSFDSHDFS